MDEFKIFCAGRFVTGRQTLEVINPYDQKAFARSWLADDNLFEEAAEAALGAAPRLAGMPLWQRSRILEDLGRALLEQQDEFARIIACEAGKPWRYALAELKRAAQTFLVAAEEARRPPMEYMRLDWTPEATGREAMVKYFPVGAVAGISPFNFPLNLAAHKIAPALAAGCPIVLKPASSTPLSTLALARLVADSGLPSGSLSILPMDRQLGSRLVEDERFKLLSFTGSPEVGWDMKQRAGKKKVVLELGGNAGTIVAESADAEHALKRCLVGGYAYQGQVCIHAQRIFVHQSHYDTFRAALTARVKALRYGNPLDPDTEITAMIDETNARRVEEWIQQAADMGASILCGGKRRGAYVEPCLIEGAGPGMKVYDEEVFGPVVSLHAFTSFAEAVQAVNNSRFGLQAGVFTRDTAELKMAFEQLEVGGVIHNDAPIFRTDHMPYGGVKDSGLGREGVRYAMHDMMEARILVS